MKDRNAFTDNQVRKVDPTEAMTQHNHVGIPSGQHPGLVPAKPAIKGVPKDEALGFVEAPSWYKPLVPKPKVCGGINKKGLPCGAHPVKGERLCVGHLRSEQGRDSE